MAFTLMLAQIDCMEQEPTFFELSDPGNFLRVTVLGLSHPNATDDWDRNWINCRFEAKSGGFTGNFEGTLMTTDIESFKQQLKRVYSSLKGTANLESLENYLSIVLTGDGIGHLEARCTLRESNLPLNELTFELEFDQTFLPNIMNQLNNITRTFPITGNFSSLKNEY